MENDEQLAINQAFHNIRTRLSLINMGTELLKQCGPLNEKQFDMMARMEKGVDQINNIIEATLDELSHLAKERKKNGTD